MTTKAGTTKPFYVWEGVYESFQSAAQKAQGEGFSGSTYSERSGAVARECLAALAQGTPIPPFHKQRSTLLPCTAAMIVSVKGVVRILDFGGGLGIGYMTLQESMRDSLHNINYSILEMPRVARIGKEMFGDKINYLSGLEGAGKFDLIHAASSLQYVQDWRGLIKTFAALDAEYLLLSDIFAGSFPLVCDFAKLLRKQNSSLVSKPRRISRSFSGCRVRSFNEDLCRIAPRRVHRYLAHGNFPENLRLSQSLHLLLQKKK